MGLIVQAIAQVTGEEFQIGVQLMRNALKASLAVAKVAGEPSFAPARWWA